MNGAVRLHNDWIKKDRRLNSEISIIPNCSLMKPGEKLEGICDQAHREGAGMANFLGAEAERVTTPMKLRLGGFFYGNPVAPHGTYRQ